MKFTLATVALAASTVAAQSLENQRPSTSAPAGCSENYNGKFTFSVVNVTSSTTKRDLVARDDLVLDLKDGVLTDSLNRIGSIVANYQFQFDGPPPQAGALFTAGFSVCQNNSLALGGSAVFYQCLSGDFYNLYDRHWAEQCNAVLLVTSPYKGTGGPGAPATAQSSAVVAPVTSAAVASSTSAVTHTSTHAPSAFSTAIVAPTNATIPIATSTPSPAAFQGAASLAGASTALIAAAFAALLL